MMSSKVKIFELRAKGYTYDKISQELGLSKATISYHCSSFNDPQKLSQEVIDKIQPLYDELGSTIKVAHQLNISKSSVKKYAVLKEVQVMSDAERNGKNVQRVVSYRQRVKRELVEYKGGACEVCGYNKSYWALQFHHVNPGEKDFIITGKSWSFERLRKEADKCVLLCANCHLEEHERLSNLKISTVIAELEESANEIEHP